MSHKNQVQFVKAVRRKFPLKFIFTDVVDVGSLDINGNNKRFFWLSNYIGIDIVKGKNVDRVGRAHNVLKKSLPVHTIISTEALEHDIFYKATLKAMYAKLVSGGLMVITAAGEGRKEHGTHENSPSCSPATNDYYQNITNEMFCNVLPPELFTTYFIRQNKTDLQFYGIKK